MPRPKLNSAAVQGSNLFGKRNGVHNHATSPAGSFGKPSSPTMQASVKFGKTSARIVGSANKVSAETLAKMMNAVRQGKKR